MRRTKLVVFSGACGARSRRPSCVQRFVVGCCRSESGPGWSSAQLQPDAVQSKHRSHLDDGR